MWHRTASDIAAAARVRDALRRILQLPPTAPIEYKTHGECLRASASAPGPPARNHDEHEPEPERSS